jgi:putative phosphoribosyl transferase
MSRFENRRDAGRRLAREVIRVVKNRKVVVAAIARGGIPVAYEVVRALKAPLEPIVVHLLHAPGDRERSLGAVAGGGVVNLDRGAIEALGVSNDVVARLVKAETTDLERRELAYRGGRCGADFAGQDVVLVDDGLATAETMITAVRAARKLGAGRVIVAAPVESPEVYALVRMEADDSICLVSHFPMPSVAAWYDDFSRVTDSDVNTLLSANRSWMSGQGGQAQMPELRF